MEAFTLYRSPIEQMSGWQDSYGMLNLSDVSIEPSGFSVRLRNDTPVIAPSLLSTAHQPTPLPCPTSSHLDAIDMTSLSTLTNPESSKNKIGPDSPTSRKSRRKRLRAARAKSSAMPEADQQRSQALAKNRLAANRYRLRQKEYVENLERRCKKEMEQRHIKSSLVMSLQQEIVRLNAEIVRQSSWCKCIHARG